MQNLNFSRVFSHQPLGFAALALLMVGLAACQTSQTGSVVPSIPDLVPVSFVTGPNAERYAEGEALHRTCLRTGSADAETCLDQAFLRIMIGLETDARQLEAQGDTVGAVAVHEERLTITKTRASGDFNQLAWRTGVGRVFESISDLHRRAEQGDRAADAAEQSLTVFRSLLADDPTTPQRTRDVVNGLGRLGDAHMVREDGPAAVAAFGEALDMVRTLAVTDPDFARANRDVYVFLFRLGEAHRIAGNNLAALDTYF